MKSRIQSTERRTAWGFPRHRGAPERRGTALFAVVPVAILVMAMMVAFVGTTVETSRASVADMDQFRARAAAQNAAAIAATDLWGDFTRVAGDDADVYALRAFLDRSGIKSQSQDPTGVVAGQTKAGIQRTSLLEGLELAKNARGRREIDGAEIERLEVYRLDEGQDTSIVIEVDAVIRKGVDGTNVEARASIQEVFGVTLPEWEGLDYAMLANNINCLLCHTTIDNAQRVYNSNSSLAGTFESVKVGSLESIHFRSDPDSRIAGVALIGGDAMQGDGTSIEDWTKFNLSAAELEDGLIAEDRWLDAEWDDLELFDPENPEDEANLFLDYFEHAESTGYTLPDSFPSPFPDDGGMDPMTGAPSTTGAGNRIVDDLEFAAATVRSTGQISGGQIAVIEKGKTISTDADRADMSNGNVASISEVVDGNVYLEGTQGQPILLDGDIAIDGDLILSGYVVGTGSIMARGNVYIVGDLKYQDGGQGQERTFGVSKDGVANSLALAAGGNIVIGDYYRPRWGSGNTETGEPGSSFNFTMDELAIFNRAEWMKTQPTLPGESYTEQVGVEVVYEEKMELVGRGRNKRWVGTGEYERVEQPVYETITPQIENPYYVEGHIPRYYSFAEGTTIPIFNKEGYFDPTTQHWKSQEIPGAWNTDHLSLADVDDTSDPFLYDANGNPIAVVTTVAPTDDWVTAEMMEKIIQLGQAGGGDKTVDIDATLYSSNAILGTIPARNSTHTNGTLIVNGGIVAADIGILAPKGTQVNYDNRGSSALRIQADSGIVLERRLSAPLVSH